MHWTELPPFAQFILILGAISFVILIVGAAGAIGWFITRNIPEPKGDIRIEFDTYDSKGRKVHRRELHESMRKGGVKG